MVRVLLISFLANLATGQGYIGINGFAMLNSKFPCKEYIELVNEANKPAISILEGTFNDDGSNYDCVRAFIDSNKDREHLVQVHLFNESCRDDGKCGKTDFYKHLNVKKFNKALETMPVYMASSIKKVVNKVNKELVEIKNSKTKVLISVGLEDNYSLKGYIRLKREVRKHTKFELMRSPVNVKTKVNGIVEYHGVQSLCAESQRIASNDGIKITGKTNRIKEFAKNNSDCYAIFYWDGAIQGRDVKFKPPLERDFRFSVALQDGFRLFLSYLGGERDG